MKALRLSEIAVGGLLLYSGIHHVGNPYYFVSSAAAYNLLPMSLLYVLPFLLANLMVVIGFCLIASRCVNSARYVATIIFCSFAFAQIFSWTIGLRISCGCFGHGLEPISIYSISIPFVCAFICLASILSSHFFITVDRMSEDSDTTPAKDI